MRRIVAGLALVGILSLMLAAPVGATTTKHPYACQEHLVEAVDGTSWVTSDLVLHVRGWTGVYRIVGDDFCQGYGHAVVDFDLSLVDSTGLLWGTNRFDLDTGGGYHLRFEATWTTADPLAPDATDIWVGRYVGHGFGAMDGWQVRGNILEKSHVLVLESGYAFLPADR